MPSPTEKHLCLLLLFMILKELFFVFFSSRLDYCNGMFTCLGQNMIQWLQCVQNTVARLLTKTQKHDHISPVVASLHRLPVHFRINYMFLVSTLKAPSYLAELLIPYSPAHSLRSSDKALLAMPRSRLGTKRDSAFAVGNQTL